MKMTNRIYANGMVLAMIKLLVDYVTHTKESEMSLDLMEKIHTQIIELTQGK